MWKVDSDFTHLLQTSSLHLRYLLTAEGNYRGNEKLNFHRTKFGGGAWLLVSTKFPHSANEKGKKECKHQGLVEKRKARQFAT